MNGAPKSERDEILGFIQHFHGSETVFTDGCCYWFGYILQGRFQDAEAVYLPVTGHFVTRINGLLYDVTGDVTEKFADEKQVSWAEMDGYDRSVKDRVIRDSVLKLDNVE